MQKHCLNARLAAEFLDKHPAVEKVYYPGLESHEGHDIAARQMRDFGGMLSFEVKGGKAAGMKLVNAVKLITVAVSLGDAETLIEHAASMTHSTYTEDELAASGIPAGLSACPWVWRTPRTSSPIWSRRWPSCNGKRAQKRRPVC